VGCSVVEGEVRGDDGLVFSGSGRPRVLWDDCCGDGEAQKRAQGPAGFWSPAPHYKLQCPLGTAAACPARPDQTGGDGLGGRAATPTSRLFLLSLCARDRNAHALLHAGAPRFGGTEHDPHPRLRHTIGRGSKHFPVQEPGPASREMTLRLEPTSIWILDSLWTAR